MAIGCWYASGLLSGGDELVVGGGGEVLAKQVQRLILPAIYIPILNKMLGRRERCLTDVEVGRKKSKIDATITVAESSSDQKECFSLTSLPVSADWQCFVITDGLNIGYICRQSTRHGVTSAR